MLGGINQMTRAPRIPLNPRSQQLQDFLTEPKPSKYRNRKVVVDGISFDSVKESKRYLQLKQLESIGHIRDLKLQQLFPLTVNGSKVCAYRADFTYTTSNVKPGHEVLVVEDVKGFKTDVYKLKYKLFAAVYGFSITEI